MQLAGMATGHSYMLFVPKLIQAMPGQGAGSTAREQWVYFNIREVQSLATDGKKERKEGRKGGLY